GLRRQTQSATPGLAERAGQLPAVAFRALRQPTRGRSLASSGLAAKMLRCYSPVRGSPALGMYRPVSAPLVQWLPASHRPLSPVPEERSGAGQTEHSGWSRWLASHRSRCPFAESLASTPRHVVPGLAASPTARPVPPALRLCPARTHGRF